MENITKKLFKSLAIIGLLFISDIKAQAPVADFECCFRVITQYESVQINDLSTNSPYQWVWDVYDSTTYASSMYYPNLANGDLYSDPLSRGNNEFSKKPEFAFDVVGCYTVKLTATNANGSGVKVKKCYIIVIPPIQFNLGYGTYGPKGDNRIYNDFGTIYDDGGPNLNYGNNQGVNTKSFLKITPANQQNIYLKFRQMKLANAEDTLFVYDADTIVPGKLLAAFTSNNSNISSTLVTTGPAMYLLFKSGTSGVDSGYQAEFYTSSGRPYMPVVRYTYRDTVINSPTVFVNQYNSVFRPAYDMKWYVDDTLKSSFTNKDTFRYTFTTAKVYRVCLKAETCDTVISYCRNINALSSLNSVKLDFGLKVYPNPFTDIIHIDDLDIDRLSQLSLFDMNGREVGMTYIQSGNKLQIQPDVNLTNGVYVLKVVMNDGLYGYIKLNKL